MHYPLMQSPPLLSSFALLTAAICLVTQPIATADPLTSEQLAKILEELKSIEEVVEGKRHSVRSSAYEKFRTAAASEKSAYDFYLECVKILRFDARDARFSEFRDWRDKNEEKLKDKSNVAALRLQLQYLVMTLRAAEAKEEDWETIVPEVEKFVGGIVSNIETFEGPGMRTLREPVTRTVFAEVYELNQSLQGLSNWSFTPADIGSVYRNTVFPYVRENNPEMLSAAWDRRIGLEKRLTEITQEDNPIALEKFEEERLPRLLWEKAEDIYKNTSEQQGALAMIKLLQTHSDHPSISGWLNSFRNLLSGGSDSDGAEADTPAENPSNF